MGHQRQNHKSCQGVARDLIVGIYSTNSLTTSTFQTEEKGHEAHLFCHAPRGVLRQWPLVLPLTG